MLHDRAESGPCLRFSCPTRPYHVDHVGGGIDRNVGAKLIQYHAYVDFPGMRQARPRELPRKYFPRDDAEAVDVAGVSASRGTQNLRLIHVGDAGGVLSYELTIPRSLE